MSIKIVFEYRDKRITFQIKVSTLNNKISSGATYIDGYEYCGFPAENNNYFENVELAILYQYDFFLEKFNKIIKENEVKSRTKAVKICKSKLIYFRFKELEKQLNSI